MDKKITIAVDGYSGCGKSTTAKGVAKSLRYTYIDSGAMYRAVTLYFLRNSINSDDQNAVDSALKKISLSFNEHPEFEIPVIQLNGEFVEEQIRKMDVSKLVSKVSSIKAVRRQMVDQQRRMGEKGGIVMDGRDIGTNVFPNAELKVFVTADIEIRTERRYQELIEKGQNAKREEIKENLLERDYIDQNRKENPLIKAGDAITLDTSDLTIDQQIDFVVQKAQEIKRL